MVLAFIEENDNSSKLVMDWLTYLDTNIKVLNLKEGEILDSLTVELSSKYSSKERLLNYDLEEFKFYYYRRGKFGTYIRNMMSLFNENALNWLRKEESKLFEYYEGRMVDRNCIGSYIKEVNTNKLFNLKCAIESGFRIPNTLVTSDKEKLLEFYTNNLKSIILKPLSDHKPLQTKDGQCFIPVGTQFIEACVIDECNTPLK